jgi:hypothetical protein
LRKLAAIPRNSIRATLSNRVEKIEGKPKMVAEKMTRISALSYRENRDPTAGQRCSKFA